jgi:hypothetical protein
MGKPAMKENLQPSQLKREQAGPPLHLAGIGTSFIAYLIDKLIQMGLVLGLTIITVLLLILTGTLTSSWGFGRTQGLWAGGWSLWQFWV